ncbi:Autophagy protein 7 [Ascosphaera acerosa]|nr:Autophagy protein 7 [Ascosphaera acerosa]
MQYAPFVSDVELPFYTALAALKIDTDKLSVAARDVLGVYQVRPADSPEASCRMQIHGTALSKHDPPAGFYRAEGTIKNVNTIEEYWDEDKSALLKDAARKIFDAINDGTIYVRPSLLASFTIISFADLKKYKFKYWFAFPALHSDPNWTPVAWEERQDQDQSGRQAAHSDGTSCYNRHLPDDEHRALTAAVTRWRSGIDSTQHGFFLAKRVHAASAGHASDSPGTTSARGDWAVGRLAEAESGFFDDCEPEDRYVCFADPSNFATAPGWMLRNLLFLIKQRWRWEEVQVLRYKDAPPSAATAGGGTGCIAIKLRSAPSPPLADLPKVTGWERNPAGKLAGRAIDLKEYMDPERLAHQSVDLNLKLMKWRISPSLDLEKIKRTSCLLLGAGTLGSYVARNLMGWGVQRITFVDNATVSFSNPVRQPLYTFADCLDGGVPKAERAAQALREIYPGVDAAGHSFAVPMLGHPVTDAAKTKADFERFQRLVDEHDAVFILMDTRESRWLPTVMGKAAGKIVMNAALGFDTFVVMRHGADVRGAERSPDGTELGCYFCNDVVAPGDSLRNRSLDQQCTVTRPGIAAIASALLVELFVSVVQHPRGAAAPAQSSPATQSPSAAESADPGSDDDAREHPLGIVPHQIRGFLSDFSNLVVNGKAYDCCSACSPQARDAYRRGGWAFVERALNERGFVEELSGLKEVQRQAEQAAAALELSDEDDSAEEGDGELVPAWPASGPQN